MEFDNTIVFSGNQLFADVFNGVFFYLSSKERSELCSVCKWFYKTLVNVSMQLSNVPHLFNINVIDNNKLYIDEIISSLNITYILDILKDYHLVVRLKMTQLLRLIFVCEAGNFDVIDLTLNNVDVLYKNGLYGAFKSGKKEVVHYIMSNTKPNHYYYMIRGACASGKKEIIDYTMNLMLLANIDFYKTIKHGLNYLDVMLHEISRLNNFELIEKIINLDTDDNFNYIYALQGAARGGNMNTIEYFLNICKNKYILPNYTPPPINAYYDEILVAVCMEGHLDIIGWVIKNSPNELDFRRSLKYSCMNGKLKTIQHLVSLGYMDKKEMFQAVCISGHIESIKYVLSLGIKRKYIAEGFINLCKRNHLDAIKYMTLVNGYELGIGEGFLHACKKGYIRMVKYLLSLDSSLCDCEKGLIQAKDNNSNIALFIAFNQITKK
jgi:hypothetical protein